MKVALLHYSAPPVVGGVETVIGHHTRLLVNAGHQVLVLAGRGGPATQILADQVPQADARLSFASIPWLDSRHEQVLAVKAELDAGVVSQRFHRLRRTIFEELAPHLAEMDVILAHNVASLNKNLALTAALYDFACHRQFPDETPRGRLVLWQHDLAWKTPRYADELHDGYPWDLLRRAWAGVIYVTISELRRRELAELTGLAPADIHVIPNGLDLNSFFKLEELTRRLVQQLDLLSAAPLLLLPVRITPRKNIELALRILHCLSTGFPQATLVVTGPLGPHNPANVRYFDLLRSLRDELGLVGRAHFLAEIVPGFLPFSVIADFYRLADALLLPSREEGFGIPLLEAGLARLPVFCSDIPPLRELVQSAGAGAQAVTFFSPDADAGHVAEQIRLRLAEDALFQQRRRVRAEYTWERIYAEKIAPLLAGL